MRDAKGVKNNISVDGRQMKLRVLILLVCTVVFAVLAMLITRSLSKSSIIKRIESQGGLVNNHSIIVPLFIAKLGKITKVDFSNQKLNDRELCEISVELHKLPQLEQLVLSYTQVSDEGMQCLTGMQSLRYLYVDNTSVTSVGAEIVRSSIDGHVRVVLSGKE